EPEFLLLWVEAVLDPEAVGEGAGLAVDAGLEGGDAAGEIVRAGVAVVVGHVLAQPTPQRLDRQEVGAVARQRHQADSQRGRRLPHRAGPVVGGAVPQHDQPAVGMLGAQPAEHVDGVRAVGARVGPQPDLALVVEVEAVERDLGREARRAGGDPQPPAALSPAATEIGVLMDVRLVEEDREVPVALRPGQHVPELLDERPAPRGVGPTEQLLALLPAQAQAVQGGTDGLAAAGPAEPLAGPGRQPPERPAGRRVGAGYGRGCGGALGGADGLTEAGLDPGAKGG